ncbi:penicillin-binding protein 2 [Bordetella pertussis]|nr:penicillin-binding protein 2 [Bordetella pertussis]
MFSLRGGQYRASAIDERLRDHALFMGFAPVEQPRIAVALIVENAGWGASAAAPIARTLFDNWLGRADAPSVVRAGAKPVAAEPEAAALELGATDGPMQERRQ